MRHRIGALSTALSAAMLLSFGAGATTASQSFSVQGSGGLLASTRLTLSGANRVDVISDVTLHGSLHAAVGKPLGSLVGVLTRVSVANCRSNIGVECEVRWLPSIHIRYLSFAGTLPRIERILAEFSVAFLVNLARGNPSCLYRGNILHSFGGTTGSSELRIRALAPLESRATLNRAEGEEFFRRCPINFAFAGTHSLVSEVTFTLQ